MRREAHALASNSDCGCRLTEGSAEPGGYLQWNDVDIDAQRLVRISESSQPTTKPTHDMMALMSKPRNSSVFKYVGANASFFSWNMEPYGTGWKPRLGKPKWEPKWGLLYSQLYAPYNQTSFNYLIISNFFVFLNSVS